MRPLELAAEKAQNGLPRCQFPVIPDNRIELAAEKAQNGLPRCQFPPGTRTA